MHKSRISENDARVNPSKTLSGNGNNLSRMMLHASLIGILVSRIWYQSWPYEAGYFWIDLSLEKTVWRCLSVHNSSYLSSWLIVILYASSNMFVLKLCVTISWEIPAVIHAERTRADKLQIVPNCLSQIMINRGCSNITSQHPRSFVGNVRLKMTNK